MKQLILGGVKSGKSLFAEQQVVDWEKVNTGEVIYIATAESHDDEFSDRIARHRSQRPAHWRTIEEPIKISEILGQVSGQGKCVLLECLTLWMSNLLLDEDKLAARVEQFCKAFERYDGEIIVVSNETGLGIMPDNAMARRFGDELGVLQQRLASLSDEVVMVVAGLPQRLKTSK